MAGTATGSTTLILVRHGETAGNRERRTQRYDTPLTDLGRAQAARVAERVAAEGPVHAIYTSDLDRARETAEIIGRRIGLNPIPDAALRELDLGDWKGLSLAEQQAVYPGGFAGWIATGGGERCPGSTGECVDDVARRVIPFVESVISRHAGGRVVLVSHGLTLGILLAHLHGWEQTEAFRTRRVPLQNTAVSVVEADEAGAFTCTLLGCTAHLEETQPPG